MTLSFLLLAAMESLSLYGGPRPEETALYRHWITGCDNERNCGAVALEAPINGTDGAIDHLEAMIEKPVHGHLAPSVTFRFPPMLKSVPDLRIFVDQIEVPLSAVEAGSVRIDGPQARRLVQAMRKGQWLYLRNRSGEAIARTSLAGLTAALLRIDEQQGRQDSPAALGRPGNRPVPRALPGYSVSITRARASDRPPLEVKSIEADGGDCQPEATDEALKPQFVRLDSDSTMAIVPWRCGNGAYARYANIMIVNGFGEVRAAEFDYDNSITGDGPSNVQAEVVWLEKERVLESATRFRAVGDCGRTDRFIWDGGKFRLSEQLVMPECRGSFDRIRVWKADVADR